jgi:tetratricopeptide (TPR) repeat protein
VRESKAIAAIEANTDFGDLIAGGVPAPDLLNLARHIIAARIAQAEAQYDEAVDAFQQAATIQDSLPYMEPPFWYYPVKQSLGAALLQAGKTEQAQRTFRQSLEEVPNNGWALYGLMQAQKAQGDAAAAETRARLDATWLGDLAQLDLARL